MANALTQVNSCLDTKFHLHIHLERGTKTLDYNFQFLDYFQRIRKLALRFIL